MKKTIMVKDLLNDLEREVEIGRRVKEQLKKKVDLPTPLQMDQLMLQQAQQWGTSYMPTTSFYSTSSGTTFSYRW